MQHGKIALVVIAIALSSCSSDPIQLSRSSDDNCAFDKAAVLALDEQNFDQDLTNGGGGWRGLASMRECELVAADLIAEYRSVHSLNSPLLFWHEGQLRALLGQYAQAISLFQHSYKPKQQDFGWNAYADATIAFLRSNRQELDKSLSDLKATPAPPGETLEDGKIETTWPDGTKSELPWPPNVDIVEGLQRCFGKPYRDAYNPSCRL